ncbi:MAG: tRNA (guanosine(37)-N1)-methyltransferase TrmD [Pirellulales bacterium]|nr:tRNA (guanosine(37)-N1)-methyltransferase TrmD [Pirellulales bacterium]
MRFDVLTLFPGMFSGYLNESLLKAAIEQGLIDVRLHNIRDWAEGKHQRVDDRPYGGGPGMVLMVKPVVECVEAVQAESGTQPGHVVLLRPQGRRLTQAVIEELAEKPRLVLICGRYEGFDERVIDILAPDEVSIGDYVLNGGEVAAMVVIDAVMRLLPGVLGHEDSSREDSFSGTERLLEHEQYTRPREFRGRSVPEILLTGNHGQIAQWRRQQQELRTRSREAQPPGIHPAQPEAASPNQPEERTP